MGFILETLTEAQDKDLQDAIDKVSEEMLNNLFYGEEKKLNKTFRICRYWEEDIVVIKFNDEDIEHSEVLQVLYNGDEGLIFEAL